MTALSAELYAWRNWNFFVATKFYPVPPPGKYLEFVALRHPRFEEI
jgi:hypothetical protein